MKNSLPYRRVDKAIITAFIRLTAEIPFEKLTVREILDEALVSRYTFYAHFHDKYEVAERLQEELYQDFLLFIRTRIPELETQGRTAHEHHQLFDVESAGFAKKNFAKIQAIKNIHTETIDFYRLLKNYFVSHYKECYADHADVELEAKIYANMVAAVMDYYSDWSQSFTPLASANVMKAHIHACAHGIGIHDEKDIKKAHDFLMALVFKDKKQ